MLNEAINLSQEWREGKVKLTEPRSGTKDIIVSFAYGNYVSSLIINDLEKLKIDPNVIIITFYKEMNFLYLLKTTDDVKKLCFTYGKEPWQLNDYNNIKDNYSLSEIKKIIIRLADYDYKYKSGLYDKSVILNIMALEFCN